MTFDQVDSPENRFQPRGVVQLSVDTAAQQVQKSGQALTTLGRWVWTRYIGKNEMMIQVITVY